MIALCALNLVLLIVVLFKISSRREDSFNEGALLRVKEELRKGSEEDFLSFQSSFDRDMAKLYMESRNLSHSTEESLKGMNNTLNSLSNSLLSLLKQESENQNRRNTDVQNTLNQNFDRIRGAFREISEKNSKHL